jgi:soluble lytic murein transglycosylase-like protein
MMWVWLGGLGDWNVNFRLPDALAHVSVPGESDVKWLPRTVSKWWPEVVEASRVHDVDPDFISFVMLQESCGYSKATSRSGAKGLIQVMPATAKDIAAKRGLSLALADQMYDPKVNLDFGAYYLGQQYRRFRVPGNEQLSIELAAAAYNGGPGSVDCYLKGGTYRYGPGMCDVSQGPGFSAETTKYRQLIGTWWRDRAAATSSNIPNNSLCKQAQGE